MRWRGTDSLITQGCLLAEAVQAVIRHAAVGVRRAAVAARDTANLGHHARITANDAVAIIQALVVGEALLAEGDTIQTLWTEP